MSSLDGVLRSLYSEPGWSTLAAVIRVLFMVAMARIVWLLARRGEEEAGARRVVAPGAGFFLLVVVPFLGVLVYQASWQLLGFTKPEFVRFMQQYDRRQFNPARAIHRGRILDRHGKILAYTFVDAANRPARLYPHHGAACHVTGYMDPIFGLAGVEAAANNTLTGGRVEDLKDWREIGRKVLAGQPEIRGDDIKVSLDIELQRAAYTAMRERPGAVVALDPRSGQVLVLLSTPTFDPARLDPGLFQGELPGTPLLNRATQGLYPPGSTFKVLLSAAALRRGFTGQLACGGDGFTTSPAYPLIKDHEFYERTGAWHGHGTIGLAVALAESCNEFFSQLGVRLGIAALRETATAFALGETTTLFKGVNGEIRAAGGPGLRVGDADRYGLAQISIGQGNLVCSPFQLALLAATVAHRGVLMKPTLESGRPPEVWRRPLTAAQSDRLAEAMRRVVTDGTGRGLRDFPVAVAGKTGTAQNPRGASHAWFIGFAPAESPKVAICVLVEHGGFGSTSAVPVARDVLRKAMELGILGDG